MSRPRQKTYWHLDRERRMPTEYDIVTSKLLCYTGEGFTGKRFELDVPLQRWYRQYQEGSLLTCTSWEKFHDPRETTYAKYTDLQTDKEIFVDSVLEQIEQTGYDRKLSASWIESLSNVLAPFRYPAHGLQMVAAYFGQTAPSGKLAITAALQAADEVRRVERIAQRVRQLQIAHSGFAANSKDVWQHSSMWQPLREIVEKLLIVYDWGESFVVLNLILKPMLDELFLKHFTDLALRQNDYLLGQIFYSLNEDCQWHREWSQALVQMAVEDTPANRQVIQTWIDAWYPGAARAVQAFSSIFDTDQVSAQVESYCRRYLRAMGLETPGSRNPHSTHSEPR
jgi:toluene monooxygenase system protein E